MERCPTIFGKDAFNRVPFHGKDAFHSVPKSSRPKEWDAVERVLTMKWLRA
jgi:hypothetical protein